MVCVYAAIQHYACCTYLGLVSNLTGVLSSKASLVVTRPPDIQVATPEAYSLCAINNQIIAGANGIASDSCVLSHERNEWEIRLWFSNNLVLQSLSHVHIILCYGGPKACVSHLVQACMSLWVHLEDELLHLVAPSFAV